jgi:catechol 2,3-dioxygenase-like lactoylglutathione lyase family enzyme
MLASSDLIAFVATTDLARARGFYEGTLGLPVLSQDDYACVLDAHGTMLRVTATTDFTRPGHTVLGWKVADITATSSDLTSRGVTFLRLEGLQQDQNGAWTTPSGDRVAWFKDPDGNTLSLTEFAT